MGGFKSHTRTRLRLVRCPNRSSEPQLAVPARFLHTPISLLPLFRQYREYLWPWTGSNMWNRLVRLPYSSLISHTIMPQVSGTAFTQAPTHRLHRSKGSPRPPKSLADSPVSFPPSLDCSVSSQGFHKAHRSHRAYLWSTSMPDTRLLAYSPTHRRPSGKGDRIKATET